MLQTCDWGVDCDRIAVAEIKLISGGQVYHPCRPHRRVINSLNAQFVGHCEFGTKYDRDSGECNHFAFTMRTVDGETFAICRMHDAVISRRFAALRKRAS